MKNTITKREKTCIDGWVRAPEPAEIAAAIVRIRGYVDLTPLINLPMLDAASGRQVMLKCEQFQRTGAFKLRGATNAVMSLTDEQLARGVATHSSGNHGASLACAAYQMSTQCWVVMPHNSSKVKRDAVEKWGGIVVECGPTQTDRENSLSTVLERTGAVPIHPYDDARVIAGQATATIELLNQRPDVRTLIVPVGGGGLAAGAILARDWLGRTVDVVGVEPKGADDTARSLAAGRRTAAERVDTIADGLRAQVGRATFPVLQRGLSDLVLVEETAIAEATLWAMNQGKLIVEPSAATVLAALLLGDRVCGNELTAAIISGGNLDVEQFLARETDTK